MTQLVGANVSEIRRVSRRHLLPVRWMSSRSVGLSGDIHAKNFIRKATVKVLPKHLQGME